MNPYEELKINSNATAKDIKSGYRRRSKEVHPDVNNGEDKEFLRVNLAYRVLSDPEKKRLYDEQGIIMDEKPDHVISMVRDRLATIANAWIDNMTKGRKVDLQKFTLDNLNQGVNQINGNIKELVKQIEELEQVHDRLKYKDGESIIHKIIKQRITSYKKGKNQNELELIVIDKVKKSIMDYEYERDKEEEQDTQIFRMMTQTFSGGTSSSTY